MRDLGILIWVALLIVGVVGSMRRQMRARGPAQPRRVPQPFRPPPAPVRPPPAPPQPPRPPPRPAPAPASVTLSGAREASVVEGPKKQARRLFPGKNEIVRGMIAAEVLGKPRGLGDEYPHH